MSFGQRDDQRDDRGVRIGRSVGIVGLTGLLACLTLTSCATALNSDTRTVRMTSEPPGAEIFVNGGRMGRTPTVLELGNHYSYDVVFRMAGQRDESCRLNTHVSPGWIVLDAFATAYLGIWFDAATKEWKSLDQTSCHVRFPVAVDSLDASREP